MNNTEMAEIIKTENLQYAYPVEEGQEPVQVLKGVNGIAQCYFTEKDVVRHRLVQEIIKAYEAAAHPAKH